MVTTEIPESPAINAHRLHDDWWASLTDEQQAEITRRRQILGSLDDTHALNRSER